MSGDSTATRLYLEDFHVGQKFTTAKARLETEAIKAFAASFDPQPFHLDEAAAKESFFGGLVASGWHTAALTMRLLVTTGLPIAGGMIGAGGEVQWPQAARPGDELEVVCEIVDVKPSRSRPDRGMITTRSETRNQKGDLLQIMTARLIVPRRNQGPVAS